MLGNAATERPTVLLKNHFQEAPASFWKVIPKTDSVVLWIRLLKAEVSPSLSLGPDITQSALQFLYPLLTSSANV
jgi:hypothetical protein